MSQFQISCLLFTLHRSSRASGKLIRYICENWTLLKPLRKWWHHGFCFQFCLATLHSYILSEKCKLRCYDLQTDRLTNWQHDNTVSTCAVHTINETARVYEVPRPKRRNRSIGYHSLYELNWLLTGIFIIVYIKDSKRFRTQPPTFHLDAYSRELSYISRETNGCFASCYRCLLSVSMTDCLSARLSARTFECCGQTVTATKPCWDTDNS